jgi:hypothetical protein
MNMLPPPTRAFLLTIGFPERRRFFLLFSAPGEPFLSHATIPHTENGRMSPYREAKKIFSTYQHAVLF